MNAKMIATLIVGILFGVVLTFGLLSVRSTGSSEHTNMKSGDDFDKEFIVGMIEHHQGAIDMANTAKNSAKHDEIKQMSDRIIRAQTEEIELMKTWQKDWGY